MVLKHNNSKGEIVLANELNLAILIFLKIVRIEFKNKYGVLNVVFQKDEIIACKQ